jgi:hypothetical protein
MMSSYLKMVSSDVEYDRCGLGTAVQQARFGWETAVVNLFSAAIIILAAPPALQSRYQVTPVKFTLATSV